MESQNDQMPLNNTNDSNQISTNTSTEAITLLKTKRKPIRSRYKEFCCDPKRNGTTTLRNHLNSCKKYLHSIETRQAQLSLQKNTSDNSMYYLGTLTTWKYDENAIREALVHIIIIDELPLRFVEGEGFRRFMRAICPRFWIPSCWTISRDCYDFFIEKRVSLTTNTWTSLQHINYMCISAYFIDNVWKLHKRIINFYPISSHKGETVGRTIETYLLEWGLDKIFTVIVDNASSNDVPISYLIKKLANWGVSVANSTYLHMRCMAHIINLIVQDGLKDVNDSVIKVRDAVRHIKSSPARLKRFKECVLHEKIESKSSLYLDVSTRWNSTYLMKITDTLAHFYELTLHISDPKYITANLFFSEVSDLAFILNQWINSNDLEMKSMGERMRFIEYSFSQIYRKVKGVELFNKIKNSLVDLFNEYKKMNQPDIEKFNDSSINPKPKFFLKYHYKKQKLEEFGGVDLKTELEVYLSETIQEKKKDFYKKMVRNILAILVSTVISESVFIIGRRVLDSFRSFLTPKIVEGLILNVEEDLDELEKLKNGISCSSTPIS
ncbi:hypothetical protein MANES_13G082916v8 [Manihot esculenta]|uniref:Uncharacterized protein n=1 Tax=Manihot esculenta TaxID=3983 RepID=A0ACB7GKC6_MANES|nr:hypothetical protein MANES_13G082916v8 [Manihot esculenta]